MHCAASLKLKVKNIKNILI